MINYGNQHIDKADINSVKKVLNSNWLTQGPTVQKFEKKLKQFIGAKYSLVLNSGTAALHVACMCLNVKNGEFPLNLCNYDIKTNKHVSILCKLNSFIS